MGMANLRGRTLTCVDRRRFLRGRTCPQARELAAHVRPRLRLQPGEERRRREDRAVEEALEHLAASRAEGVVGNVSILLPDRAGIGVVVAWRGAQDGEVDGD